MPLFKKVMILDIVEVGQAKISEEVGFIPYVSVAFPLNDKVFPAVKATNNRSAYGFS